MLYESSSKDQKRILWVAISLMIAVSVIVLALTLWMLYQSNLKQRVQELQAMVQGLVALIEAVAKFDPQAPPCSQLRQRSLNHCAPSKHVIPNDLIHQETDLLCVWRN